MIAATAVAASAELRAKRNRFASSRSFSANDMRCMKRKQKLQTINAADIMTTYQHTISEDGISSSDRVSSTITHRHSRGCSPVIEKCPALVTCGRSNSILSPGASFSGFLSTTYQQFDKKQQQTLNNLQLPSSISSSSTASIDPRVMGADPHTTNITSIKSASCEIPHQSRSDDLDDFTHHDYCWCGHMSRSRCYDQQYNASSTQSKPIDARKRFIQAVNRIRMESMVCTALRSDASSITSSMNQCAMVSSESKGVVNPCSEKAIKSEQIINDNHTTPEMIIIDEEICNTNYKSSSEIWSQQINEASSPQTFQQVNSSSQPSSPFTHQVGQFSSFLTKPESVERQDQRKRSSSISYSMLNPVLDHSQQKRSSSMNMVSNLEQQPSPSTGNQLSFMALIRIAMLKVKRQNKNKKQNKSE